MKYIFTTIFIIVMLFTPSSAFAQKLGIGAKLGVNSSDFHGGYYDIEWWSSKNGFCAGGFISYTLFDIIAIQPEILYTQKGAKMANEYWGDIAVFTMHLNYLEIPLLVKFTMPIPGKIRPNLFVGPYFSKNLTAKYTMKVNGESDEEDIDESIKNTDFGVIYGGGVDFGLPVGKIVVDMRFTMGTASIDDSPEELDIKNKAFSFMLGYGLRL